MPPLPPFPCTGIRLLETHIWLLISSRRPPQGHRKTIRSVLSPWPRSQTASVSYLYAVARAPTGRAVSWILSANDQRPCMTEKPVSLRRAEQQCSHLGRVREALAAVSASSGPLIKVFPRRSPVPNQLDPSALPAVVVDHCKVRLWKPTFLSVTFPSIQWKATVAFY